MPNRLPATISSPALAAGITVPAQTRVDFNHDISPILTSKCYAYRGRDGDKRKAHLRIDRQAEAVRKAIGPRKPEASELRKRVTSRDMVVAEAAHGRGGQGGEWTAGMRRILPAHHRFRLNQKSSS